MQGEWAKCCTNRGEIWQAGRTACQISVYVNELLTSQNGGHIKNIHLHRCKHRTVKLTVTLTLTDTGGAVLTLMLGLRNYKLKRKIQI